MQPDMHEALQGPTCYNGDLAIVAQIGRHCSLLVLLFEAIVINRSVADISDSFTTSKTRLTLECVSSSV
eukprot:4213-Eustigmatos_ZCMA.PRE.1